MAEKENQEQTNDGGQAAAPRNTSLAIVGFIGLVIVVETLLFFFMVPSADEVAALAESQLIQQVKNENQEEIEKEDDGKKVVEFQLGPFAETFSPLGTEKQYAVEFRLFGTLREKNLAKMTSEFAEKDGRLQHAVRMVIRNSRLEELMDNQLGLIERRILATCNSLLEEPILLSVGFEQWGCRED
ncbi:MAG: dihydrolipoamide acetyltransferase [Pirellulaceae bacterium]